MGLIAWIIWLICSALADPASATVRWVIPGAGATGCTNGASNYNPTTNTCGSGSSLVYTSHNNVATAMQSCDTAIYRAGSYSGWVNIVGASKSGTPTCNTIFRGYYEGGEIATLTGHPTSVTLSAFQLDEGASYIEFSSLTFDMSATGGRGMCVYLRGNLAANHHIRFVDNVCHDVAQAMSVGVNTGVGDHYIARNTIYRTGLRTDLDPPGKNTFYGLGSRTIIEHNIIHDVCNGISVFSSGGGSQNDGVIRYNWLYNVGRRDLYAGMEGMQCQTAIAQPSAGSGWKVYGNVIFDSFTLSTDVAIRWYLSYNGTSAQIYNNTIYNTTGKGIAVEKGTGAVVRNNIAYLTTSTAVDITGGTGSASNNLSTDPSFVDAANNNFTLAAGSAAIAAGSNAFTADRPCNGVCDIGAYETVGFSSGTLAGNMAEVTLGMNLHTPVAPTTAGWSLNCTPNPTACPTPTIIGAVLKPGTSSTVQLTYSGTACAAGQTWTVSYNPATGATTDTTSQHAFEFQQELSTITTQSLTNGCDGSGSPTPPANPHIHYLFNENVGTNANDETANNLDCTLTNSAGWGTGLTGSGLLLVSGTTQHCAINYGNAVNPTSTSLTIAFWAKLSSEGLLFGPDNGTSQRLLIGVSSGTARLGIQSSNTATASEFGVTLGDWTHFCLTLDKDTPGGGTGTATLHIDGVAGSSAGAKKTYTSYSFASNWRLGNADVNPSPGVQIDNFKTWTSVVSCADEYASSNPPSTPWTGNLASVAFRFYHAKHDAASALIPMAAVGTNITVPAGAAFTFASQIDGTVSDPTPIAYKLYYHCALCPSADADLAVPATASMDGIEFWGTANEQGLLSGDHGARLSGALTYVAGGTNLTADSIPVVDLAQNNSTVMRWILRIPASTPQGRVFCLTPREQTGVELDGSVEGCVTVGPPIAHGGP